MNNLKHSLLFLGFIAIIALVYYVGPVHIISKIKTAKRGYLLLGGGLYSFSMVIRSIKWNMGLKLLKADCRFVETFWVYLFSGMICYFTPWKTGDLVAPFVFKKHFNHSVGGGVSVVLIDRIFEFLVLTFLVLAATLAFSFRLADASQIISTIIKGVVVLLTGVLALSLLVISLQVKTKKVLSFFYDQFNSPMTKNIIKKATQALDNFYMSINQLKNKSFLLKIFFYTCLSLTADALFFYFIINSTITVGLMDCLMVQFITIGIALASFTPTGMGVLELSVIYLFSLLNYPQVPITSGMLLMRVISMGLTVLGGMLAMGVMRGWSRA